jgi:hypothetical protein
VTVFLDADCVFSALAQEGFIKAQPWKMPKASQYSAKFFHGFTNGTLCFMIDVHDGIHKVSVSYIKNLERLYGVNLSSIVSICAA